MWVSGGDGQECFCNLATAAAYLDSVQQSIVVSLLCVKVSARHGVCILLVLVASLFLEEEVCDCVCMSTRKGFAKVLHSLALFREGGEECEES